MKHHSYPLKRQALTAALALAAQTGCYAQAYLPAVTVTANPLGATDLIAPADVLTGTALKLRAKSTLGETLDGTPGVSSSYFGPNASRPTIRGLDGDRVRVLQNSGAMVDAAGHSFDHAVPSDPIAMERIEVLRGPGTLMYGGSAVGGVVNVMDNRIAQEPLFDAQGGLAGKVHLGTATGNSERAGAVLLQTGTERFTLHADAFARSAGDTAVPQDQACTQVGAPTVAKAICNSAATARGAALGVTWFGSHSRLGFSASAYQSDYGTVAEDNVTIGMKSTRYALEWDANALGGWIESLQLRASHGDYQHTEYDSGEAGTTFQNTGNDVRIHARHAPIATPVGAWQGVLGVQLENNRFSAVGAEAFAPFSRTGQAAVFAFEELPLQWGRISLGARWESVNVESLGNPEVDRFVPASRSFSPRSLALGALWNVADQWQLTSNLAYSERAPKDYELFANGPHIATHAYEIGNPQASVEQSTNVDVGVKWRRGANAFQLTAFANRFSNYLAQEATGAAHDMGDGNFLPEYAYNQVAARFIGWEASGKLRLWQAASSLDLELRADAVRATNTDTNQALPRIAPMRLGAAVVWTQGAWMARLDANHAAAQTDVPAGQLGTDAYTLTHASLTYQQSLGKTQVLWLARLDNIGDVLAYPASSILTQTAPGKAPLPGRSLRLGVQVVF